MNTRMIRSISIIGTMLFFFALALIQFRSFFSTSWITELTHTSHFIEHWRLRAVLSCSVFLFWGILFLLVRLIKIKLRMRSPTSLLILSLIGLGIATIFGLHLLNFSLGSISTIAVGITPLFLFLFYYLPQLPKKSLSDSTIPVNQHSVMKIAYWFISLAIGSRFLASFFWLPFYKGPPVADEPPNWWGPTLALAKSGFSNFMTDAFSGYSPGYPLISSVLLAPVPVDKISFAMVVLPFLFALPLFEVLFSAKSSRRWTHKVVTLSLAFLAFYFFIYSHMWIYTMFFQLNYGECMAVLFVSLVFVAMDIKTFQLRSRIMEGILLFGFAFVCALSKPPIEILLGPVVVPTLLIAFFLLSIRKDLIKLYTIRGLSIFAGVTVAKIFWKLILAGAHKHHIFELTNYEDFLNFDPEIPFGKMLPFIIQDYKQVWLGLTILVPVSLMMNWKRYLPTLIISFGLIASIFLLYGTVWKTVEYASGGRYILHGAYGWMFYFLGTSIPLINRLMFSRTRKLLSIFRREATSINVAKSFQTN